MKLYIKEPISEKNWVVNIFSRFKYILPGLSSILLLLALFFYYEQYLFNGCILIFTQADWLILLIIGILAILNCISFMYLFVRIKKLEGALFELSEQLVLSEDNIIGMSRATQSMIIEITGKMQNRKDI